ncbi:4'-phosphopantetheinyl transferase superfamily protein [Nonomuraea sp. NPDC050643]|uniref:4'-phosphopantetheinyl transferase family protein n=1 Tax=Nonomuraea sp. NPDC050643 TaxID=3155660 RepID=UPI0033BFC031
MTTGTGTFPAASTTLAPALEAMLPPGVACAESTGDEPIALFPEEEEAIRPAVAKRRREFTTVRACARRALDRLGHPPVPIVPGERGAPRWPAGVVGSMTHCEGYRGAAVARTSVMRTLGIDAEPHAPLPDGVLEVVSLPAERRHLEILAAVSPEVHWDRLLFSAKESVYKAWFPLTRRRLGFEDALITLAGEGVFWAVLRVPPVDGAPVRFTGRWRVVRGLVMTAIAVPR